MRISNYLKTKIIDCTLRGIAYTPPTTHYLALYTTDPTDTDIGTEVVGVTGAPYVRQPITFDADALGFTQNSSDIIFGVTGSTWGNITHIGIRDALTGGNLLYHSELTIPRNVVDSMQLEFLKGQIDLSIT